ncbi:hypothetical protein BJX65DRAFT_279606, partial [Aspergillus insuetus]
MRNPDSTNRSKSDWIRSYPAGSFCFRLRSAKPRWRLSLHNLSILLITPITLLLSLDLDVWRVVWYTGEAHISSGHL